MNNPVKVVTVVGTRPEIIRLSRVIDRLDATCDHVLVHTGQNYDYELNEIFFSGLGLRRPDHFLEVDTSSLGATLGDVLAKTERVLNLELPDALLILGDTNSSLAAIMGRRLRVPVYHMEAGNRCFDENVPEEVNRRVVDHVADYNLAYTEHARRNLLAEGLHPSRIMVTGSPMREVLAHHRTAIDASDVLERQHLTDSGYFMVSLHREENVDHPGRLMSVLSALRELSELHDLPVLVSTHPRTRKRLADQPAKLVERLILHPPFGFHDYVRLQCAARAVLSDSGTISEEASILGFPAVTLRDTIERPEALDTGSIICAGVQSDAIIDAVRMVLAQHAADGPPAPPEDYGVTDCARRVVNFIRSTAHSHHDRAGLRTERGGLR